jgi:hypothetical protein
MQRRSLLAFASSLMIAFSCGGDRVAGPPVPAAPMLSIVPGGGDNQTGTVGTLLPLPLIVQLSGISGSLNGQILTFVVTSGGGTVFAPTVLTGTPNSGPAANRSGIGQNTWTLGPTAGPQSVEARLVDAKTGQTLTQATFRATAVVGTANSLKVAVGDQQTALAGALVSVPPAVLVTDRSGNPIENVTVAFQVTGGGGSITGAAQVATNSSGIATLGGWRLGTTTGANTLTASAAGLTGSPLTFTAAAIAGAAASLTPVAGDGQRAATFTALPLAPKVEVRDANGNGVAGVAVTFTVMTGGGSMDGITSVTTLTNQSGAASVGWTLGPIAAANTLRATALELSGSPVTFRATAYEPFYVANQNANSITIYDPDLGGNVSPVRTISGSNTTLNVPGAMTRDAAGQLYLTNISGGSILVFAPGAGGNVAPIRSISGPNTGLSRPFALTRDAGGNIYVYDYDRRAISVFAADASGNASPVRVIAGANTGLAGVPGLRVAPNGEIYAIDQDADAIRIFAAGASGDVAAVRTITGPSTNLHQPGAVELDAAGRLFVTNFRGQSIDVYDPGATGDAAPLRTIGGPSTGLSFPTGIAFDRAGQIYVSNYIGQRVTVYAPNASGDATPIRTVTGSNTGLVYPGWLTF